MIFFSVSSRQVAKHCHSQKVDSRLRSSSSEIARLVKDHDSSFLRPLEEAIQLVLSKYNPTSHILDIEPSERESLAVARNLNDRLQSFRHNNNCPRCWLQPAHCICSQCPPLTQGTPFHRIFLLMHHKEVCLTVDTAKLIFSAFPSTSRMVVAGIGSEYQTSMQEFLHATRADDCLVLFPDDDARTYQSILVDDRHSTNERRKSLIVIDGTWEQARRLYKRYIVPHEGLRSVRLTEAALQTVTTEEEGGRQLRRHPQLFREISTLAALRLFLRDVDSKHEACTKLTQYQKLADAAARKQLGEIRYRQT
ncbi:hypothetical protein FisN_4Lh437 [Fistulifera solaris]|uniref:tRNA-uridine aminocarboxypropyltransferase n=1 Tax=Fistulifera solaris TaxID=1519565 RepID=A0A1Z5KDZ2_FISSO|nr:hypothetical protein FisN_4Lh437 [Fistulifera solaris]|eukprot:GAX24321.1 hypothetical protein FisN_4Lh437 [Fistulifera solaris]